MLSLPRCAGGMVLLYQFWCIDRLIYIFGLDRSVFFAHEKIKCYLPAWDLPSPGRTKLKRPPSTG